MLPKASEVMEAIKENEAEIVEAAKDLLEEEIKQDLNRSLENGNADGVLVLDLNGNATEQLGWFSWMLLRIKKTRLDSQKTVTKTNRP